MSENLFELGEYIALKLVDEVEHFTLERGELTIFAKREYIVKTIRFLHDDNQCKFISIADICAVDYPERELRFDVVYHLLSPIHNQRIRVKISTDEESLVPSITSIFPGANWYEREAYDMFGILFSEHPDLRRLLTDYGFSGYPLRKDFPLSGYVELRYDEELKRVVYEPTKLLQQFRSFDNLSPWESAEYILPSAEKEEENRDV